MHSILIDTGFWYALYTQRDQYHEKACEYSHYIEDAYILFPYPSLYEVLNTRFVKNKSSLSALNEIINSNRVNCIDDTPYRNNALEVTLKPKNNKSFVDNIIRLMLDDKTLKINGFITFNSVDFKDVCIYHNIEMLSD